MLSTVISYLSNKAFHHRFILAVSVFLLFSCGVENEREHFDIMLPATNWLATTRDYILKIEGDNLMHSSDLGKHWKSMKNKFDSINFVHWFSDGTCLICSPNQAYYTKDFDVLYESKMYDFDGSPIVTGTGCHSFFHEFNYNSKNIFVGDRELVIWTDYDIGSNYISRIWYSADKGRTVKCILKNKESIIDGDLLSIRHFHDSVWDDIEKCLWVTTGDFNDENMLIKGIMSDGEWDFSIVLRGEHSKFGQISYDDDYLYLVTDFTSGDAPRGLVRVKRDSVSICSAYQYLYVDPNKTAFIQFFDDGKGHRILFPDGAQKNVNKLYYASQSYDFRMMSFACSDGAERIIGQTYGPNNNGDIIVITYRGGYGGGFTMNMNRYLLSDGLKAAGLL